VVTLQKNKVSTKYITLIKDMYNNVVTSVRTSNGDTSDFPINIGLHQGSALSPYLFALVMDEVIRDIQGGIIFKAIRRGEAWRFTPFLPFRRHVRRGKVRRGDAISLEKCLEKERNREKKRKKE
jgi:hypothetical protein